MPTAYVSKTVKNHKHQPSSERQPLDFEDCLSLRKAILNPKAILHHQAIWILDGFIDSLSVGHLIRQHRTI